jgi:hypothetical protein
MKRLIAAGALAWLATSLCAHETDQTLPVDGGFRVGLAVALTLTQAEEAWPMPRLPGVLTSGQTPKDRRDLALEHGTLAVGIQSAPNGAWKHGAALVLGWHDDDPYHVEEAWGQISYDMADEQTWRLRAGRQKVAMGAEIDAGGHFDRLAALPLAKRAVLDGDWIEDGLSLRWQADDHAISDRWWPRLEAGSLGLSRGHAFPGGQKGQGLPSAHVVLALGPGRISGFAASLRVKQRGGLSQNAQAAHTHAQPDCSGTLTGVFCFDGRSDVLGGSVSWPLPWAAWKVQSAGLVRRDRGSLYSANGEVAYKGTSGGTWSDLIWQPSPRLELIARGESVRGVNTLQGAGSALVARDAGLTGNTRLSRFAGAAAYRINAQVRLSLEAGAERQGELSNHFGALRLVWTPAPLIQKPFPPP